MEAEIEGICLEDGGKGHRAKKCQRPLEAKKGKEINFPPRASRKDTALPTPWF